MERFSALSVETVRIPVSATDNTGALVTLTSYQIQAAFLPEQTEPAVSDWLDATWDTDTSTTPATQLVSILIGPATTAELTASIWQPWVKIFASPETKVGEAAECILVY